MHHNEMTFEQMVATSAAAYYKGFITSLGIVLTALSIEFREYLNLSQQVVGLCIGVATLTFVILQARNEATKSRILKEQSNGLTTVKGDSTKEGK